MFFADAVKSAFKETRCQETGHTGILVQVIAAVPGSGTGDLTLVIADELVHCRDEGNDLRGSVLACEQQVEARAASHGAEIDDPVAVFRAVSQEGGAEVFDRVHLRSVHDGLAVGGGHAEVECGDGGIAVVIDAGDIDTGLQYEVVDGKAGDFFQFHVYSSNGQAVRRRMPAQNKSCDPSLFPSLRIFPRVPLLRAAWSGGLKTDLHILTGKKSVCKCYRKPAAPAVLLLPPAVHGCLLFTAARCSRPPRRGFTGNNDLLTTEKYEENTEEGQVLRFLSGKSVSVVKSS